MAETVFPLSYYKTLISRASPQPYTSEMNVCHDFIFLT